MQLLLFVLCAAVLLLLQPESASSRSHHSHGTPPPSPDSDSGFDSSSNTNSEHDSDSDSQGDTSSSSVDPDLITLSENLYRLDQQNNAAQENVDWTVDTRSKNGRLFTKLNQDVLNRPTYAKFIALLDNYDPVLGHAEEITPVKLDEQVDFINAIFDTAVMQKAWDYLKSNKLAPSSAQDFKDLLQWLWFTVYARRGGQPDSSGFEHVFVGEIDGSARGAPVEGFHNWIRYYLEEAAGRVVYQKWKGQTDPDLFGMQFSWNGHVKTKSTMAIGESPEMSFAILTTCLLSETHKSTHECKYRMAGAPVRVMTFKWTTKNSEEFYVASAYYED